MKSEGDVFDILLGQFPQHCQKYYESVIDQNRAILARSSNSRGARNDIAVACLMIGRYDEALAELNTLEKYYPGKFETLANFAALYRATGDYGRSIEYSVKALRLNPEGNLGVGQYHLKMLRFLESTSGPGAKVPTNSFLGFPYSDFPNSISPDNPQRQSDHLTKLTTLMRAEPKFADGMLALGDYLYTKHDWRQAFVAYLRAKQLGHPNPQELDRRIDLVYGKLRLYVWTHTELPPRWLEDRDAADRSLAEDVAKAEGWLARYQEIEAQMIPVGVEVAAADVERELINRGFPRVVPRDYGLRRGGLGYVLTLHGLLITGSISYAFLWIVLKFRKLVIRLTETGKRVPA